MKIPNSVTNAVAQRAGGGQASWWQATMAATAAGFAVGVTVYRVLRNN